MFEKSLRGFLPEHPYSAILGDYIMRYCYWMRMRLPEDLFQEAALLLWERYPNPNGTILSEEERSELRKEWGRRLWKVRIKYGFRKGASGDADQFERYEEYAEDHDGALAEDTFAKAEESKWYRVYYAVAKQITLDAGASDEWQALELFLSGKNVAEIGHLVGWTTKFAQELVESAIKRIREKCSVPLEFPLPHGSGMHLNSRVRMEDTERRNYERINIPATMKNHEIMEKFGVSRTTAWRARERGWVIPNYHPHKRGRSPHEHTSGEETSPLLP